MLMYEDNGVAIRFMDQIVLANPGNEAWQRHFVESYGSAAAAIGFNGFTSTPTATRASPSTPRATRLTCERRTNRSCVSYELRGPTRSSASIK
jgi:hypothetical protein